MIRDTKLQNTTEPAIAYSTCYAQPFTGFKLVQNNKSDLKYLLDWIDLKTQKDDETGTMIIEKITEMLKEKKADVITRYSFQEIEKILFAQIDCMIECVNDSQGTIDPSEDIADIETTLKVLRLIYNM